MGKYKGQQAIEFVLISSLVLIGALATTLTFGDKIAGFFENDSAIAKTSKAKSTIIKSNSSVAYTPDYKSSYSALVDNPEMTQYNVIQNSDGSVSFTVGTQNVNLPANVVQLQDTVMQTTGSSGATELIKDIATLINTYKAEFGGTVPINLSFGLGDRNDQLGYNSSYTGNSAANITTVMAGKHVIINHKDQTCDPGDGGSSACTYTGSYKISGTMNSSNQLTNASVSVVTKDNLSYTGSFSGSVNTTSGIKISNGNFTLNSPNPVDYLWNIDCSNSANQYNI